MPSIILLSLFPLHSGSGLGLHAKTNLLKSSSVLTNEPAPNLRIGADN